MKRAVGVGLISVTGLALVALLLYGFGRDPHAVPFLLKGKAAPPFTLKTLDGAETISLAQLKGRPVVINFWASWCGPCQQEHPVLEWGARKFGDQVQFLGVIFEDTDENARKALKAQGGGAFPQLIDPLSHMSVDYGASGVPETYFIDGNGIIQDKYAGPIDPEQLTQMITRVSQSSPTGEARK